MEMMRGWRYQEKSGKARSLAVLPAGPERMNPSMPCTSGHWWKRMRNYGIQTRFPS